MTDHLPAGETLPEYDDEHPEGVDLYALRMWLIEHGGSHWQHADQGVQLRIRDVLAALQAVGDATLVKNDTYRAMRRDGVEIERLAAWLANHGFTAALVEHGGNPVSVTITALTAAQTMVTKLAEVFVRAWTTAVKDEA